MASLQSAIGRFPSDDSQNIILIDFGNFFGDFFSNPVIRTAVIAFLAHLQKYPPTGYKNIGPLRVKQIISVLKITIVNHSEARVSIKSLRQVRQK